jgi:hypothetical protein
MVGSAVETTVESRFSMNSAQATISGVIMGEEGRTRIMNRN